MTVEEQPGRSPLRRENFGPSAHREGPSWRIGFLRHRQVEISAADIEGHLFPGYGPEVFVHVVGDGNLLGMENGAPDDLTSYAKASRRTFNGRLIAYIRKRSGNLRLIAWSSETGEKEILL